MQFDRVIRAKVLLTNSTYTGYDSEVEINNLRMQFSIKKTLSTSTNTCTLKIYNLGADNRNRLKEFGDQLRLFAGYRQQEGAQLIFIGNVNQLNHSFLQPEIVSTLTCGDGERNLNNIMIPVSFDALTPVRTVIEYVAEKLGFPIAVFEQTSDEVYENGYYDIALAKDVLTNACQRMNLYWSVQNENLYILSNNGATLKPPAEINAETGMIGIPERYVDKRYYLYRALPPNAPPKPGWRFRTLLRPDILPGDKIRLRSVKADVDGEFRVLTISHDGDNYGLPFESSFEVYPL